MKFESRIIPFFRTNQFPKLFLDYVNGEEKLRRFYSQPNNESGFRFNAALPFADEKRKILVDVIRDQYRQTGISNEPLLSKLADKNTSTVCTGHQLCLFTGPLYFIFKIITTIKLSNELSEKEISTVPVYWMASEDHDFAEIAEVNLFGKKLKWELVSEGAVGDLKTDSLKNLIDELKTVVGAGVHADELMNIITQAYRPGRTLAQAMRELVHLLFEGRILVLDGNDARLKKQLAGLLTSEIAQGISEMQVNASIAELKKLGYDAQVNPRRLNFFLMKPGVRERIEEKDGNYSTVNGKFKWTSKELMEEIDAHPENFSPNVVLRPQYQQKILPNIAYIGGPGELSYWLEYLEMFRSTLSIPFPVLVPRNFALITDRNSLDKWERTGLSIEQIFDDIEQSVSSFVKNNAGDEISLEDERVRIKLVYDDLKKKAMLQDATLGGAVDAELQKQLNALNNLEGKMVRAAKQKMESSVNQLRKTREKLLPGNVLQERYENFIPYYLKYGKEFFQMLEDAFGNSSEGLQLLIAD